MKLKISIGMAIGLMLCLSALYSSSATALTAHVCLKSLGTEQGFTDSTCSVKSAEGSWHTVKFSGRFPVSATLTPTTAGMNATEGEEAGTHVVVHGTLGGVNYQATCTGLSSPNSEAENSGGAIAGEGSVKLSGCSMKKPTQCTIPETIESVALSVTSKEDKLTFAPKTGTAFVTISVSGEKCPLALKGEKTVEGTAVATAASPTALEFTNESGSSLTLGGQPTQFTAVMHFLPSLPPVAIETP